jgi:methionine-rich copper-binding protein CopC
MTYPFYPMTNQRKLMKHLLKMTASLALALGTSSTFAHAMLQGSTPANGATLASSPGELRFAFNEPVEPAMSSVKVIGPDGSRVPAEKPAATKDDDKALLVRMPKLPAGAYQVEWSTMGHDGHHTKGALSFVVK